MKHDEKGRRSEETAIMPRLLSVCTAPRTISRNAPIRTTVSSPFSGLSSSLFAVHTMQTLSGRPSRMTNNRNAQSRNRSPGFQPDSPVNCPLPYRPGHRHDVPMEACHKGNRTSGPDRKVHNGTGSGSHRSRQKSCGLCPHHNRSEQRPARENPVRNG